MKRPTLDRAKRQVGFRLGIQREHALCLMLRSGRLSLPSVTLQSVYPNAADVPVTVTDLPSGPWATPLGDVVVLLKLVALASPRRVLELGSYRGATAKAIAEHMPADGRVVAVDIEPDHGIAYRFSDVRDRIDRRMGAVAHDLFSDEPDGAFDLVFLDADHEYGSVKSDTETVLRLVSPNGWMVWHDYSNYGAFSGICGVPEYLNELVNELPIARLEGTGLAVHRPSWCGVGGPEYERALAESAAALAEV